MTTPADRAPAPPIDPHQPASSPPLPPTQETSAHPTLVSATGAAGGDACPSCGFQMAPDQRYCLECGQRRGDPRLPFMDAVVFMEAVKNPPSAVPAAPQPPPPPREKRSSISANASLIAGVGTLLLALGIGVLIGKTGEGGSTTAAAPSVITVPSGGATASTGTESGTEAGGGAKGKGSGGGKAPPAKAKKGKENLETGSSGASKGVEEVLKPTGNVKFAPSTVKKGESCEEGTAGCSGGKFEGSFFE